MTTDDLSIPDLQDQITQTLRAYLRASKADRPDLLRTAAELTVQMRERFLTQAGDPDWLGATGAYRRASGEIWAMLGLTPGRDRSRVQEALRWHVSNVLRDRLDARTLQDLGLRDIGARERGTERRKHYRAAIEAGRKTEYAKGHPLRILGMGLRAITTVSAAQVSALPDDRRVEVLRIAEDLEAEAARLRRAAKA